MTKTLAAELAAAKISNNVSGHIQQSTNSGSERIGNDDEVKSATMMTTITTAVSAIMTMVTAANDDNCGGVSGVEDDDGDSGQRQRCR